MSRWGGTSGTFQTLAQYVATAGVAQNDFAVDTSTIPGGWDGNDPTSTSFTVYHTYQFTNVNGDVGPTTVNSQSSTITMPSLSASSLDPPDHERTAFAERYGVTSSDGWPYILSYQWEVYGPAGNNITSFCTFSSGGIVNHPTGNGTTYDATHTWQTYATNVSGGVFQAGSYAYLRRTIQIMDDNGPQIDISGDYNGFNVPVSQGGPEVRLELKSGRDGNAGDGPFFATNVAIFGSFATASGGIPVAVGTGKRPTIITA